MAGKHEPASRASFYLSLSTAALRAALVIGAVVLGIFVLARAFPGAGERPPPITEDVQEEDAEEPTGGDDEQGMPEQPPPESPDFSDVELQVLNGAGVPGLAECTGQHLLEEEGFQDAIWADAEGGPYERSIVYFQPNLRGDARYLRRTYFRGAELQRATQGANFQLSVVLGADYAEDPVADCPSA